MADQPNRPLMVLPRSAWEDELTAELERRGIPDAALVARAAIEAVLKRAVSRLQPIDAPD